MRCRVLGLYCDKMKLLKRISFGLLGVLLVVLTLATILEKMLGTDFASTYVYSSLLFVILWCVLSVCCSAYILKRKLQRRPLVFLLHVSFLLILAGAFVTWLCGERGTLHLQKGTVENSFMSSEEQKKEFPFRVSMEKFEVIYYTGTRAPMDFVTNLVITAPDGKTTEGRVSMNRIFSYQNYRFYQSGYDADGEGTVLSISHDPYGIAVTYMGYALLLLSILLFFFDKHSDFRRLMNSGVLKRSVCIVLLGLATVPAMQAADAERPKTLPKEVAAQFGDLYVLYNNRVYPLQTLAKDFTMKLYGSATYRGLTPEQVFTGWIFYYSSWKDQPMIKIKSGLARRMLGTEGRYVALSNYTDAQNQYKLDEAVNRILAGEASADKRGIEEANEKYNLIAMLYSGKMLKLYPYCASAEEPLEWYAQADRLPQAMGEDEAIFVRKSLSYVQEMVMKKDYEGVSSLLAKIKVYQGKRAGDSLPGAARFNAEKWYNGMDYTKPMAVSCIIIGLLAFIYYCRKMMNRKHAGKCVTVVLDVLLALVFIYLTAALVLRGYVSNHLPLSNGFETMQFMAWAVLLLTFLFQRRFALALPFGFLLCGLALMVSMLGEANPQITQLMPVLASPLLCIHVVIIMVAYSLLAFMMLNGVTAVFLHFSRQDCSFEVERLQVISRLMLYPAVFLLTVGIFIGAVWANVSWGRYWGWDPKEVWALITMLVYALALHPASLPWFRRPMLFHVFSILAFLSVLITYFGVNFLLGGMHSYA